MADFALASAEDADPRRLAQRCAGQLGATDDPTRVGFVYATDALAAALPEILEILRRETGMAQWTGTVGSGVCSTGREYYDGNALVALAAPLAAQAYRALPSIEDDIDAALAPAADWLAASEQCVGVVHADPRLQDAPQRIGELAQRLPNGFLIGGFTSSEAGYPQIADGAMQSGLSGLLLNEQVPLASGLTQGVSPLGPRHIVTAAERNIVIELDNRPALDVFREDVGELLARDLGRVAGYIFVGMPVAGSDRADYLVRQLTGIDTGQKLLGIGDWVQSGQTLMFCKRDLASAEQDLRRMLVDLRERTRGRARAGLYFSCLGRGRHLFGEQSREMRLIAEELGELPLVGFFGNGEISHNRLYGYTGVLSLFL